MTTPSFSSLEIFALFMATGVGSTLLVKETMNKTLEDLSNETQDGFVEGVVAPVEIQDGIVAACLSELHLISFVSLSQR